MLDEDERAALGEEGGSWNEVEATVRIVDAGGQLPDNAVPTGVDEIARR